jgi:glycosyltransferase involved in cell wall biosynthesis
MRVGFFTDSYLPATHGVEVSIETFRRNLEKAGHQVFVYAPAVPGYIDRNRRVFRFKSIRVIDVPEMRLALPVVQDGNLQELTRFPLDVVHVHTPFTVGLLGKHIANQQRIPIIYTHHTHYPEYAKAYLRERVVLPFLAKSLSAWFSNMSDAVIAPSPKIKTLLKAYGVRKPIYVLPTGIRLQQFKRTRTSARKARALRTRLAIPRRERVLLFVGRLGREKNIDFLLLRLVS